VHDEAAAPRVPGSGKVRRLVSIGTLEGGSPVDVRIGGKRITLPATDEAITAVLGPPLHRD
jgi:hypothetical protein